MKSLLVVIKEEFLSKGIALALMDSFQSIHTTKNPYEAIRIMKEENINVIITELGFNTLESNSYWERLTDDALKGTSIIVIKENSISLTKPSKIINFSIQEKPISIQNIKTIIKSFEENTFQLNKGEK